MRLDELDPRFRVVYQSETKAAVFALVEVPVTDTVSLCYEKPDLNISFQTLPSSNLWRTEGVVGLDTLRSIGVLTDYLERGASRFGAIENTQTAERWSVALDLPYQHVSDFVHRVWVPAQRPELPMIFDDEMGFRRLPFKERKRPEELKSRIIPFIRES